MSLYFKVFFEKVATNKALGKMEVFITVDQIT